MDELERELAHLQQMVLKLSIQFDYLIAENKILGDKIKRLDKTVSLLPNPFWRQSSAKGR